MTTGKKRIQAYVTDEVFKRIVQSAKDADMSVSELVSTLLSTVDITVGDDDLGRGVLDEFLPHERGVATLDDLEEVKQQMWVMMGEFQGQVKSKFGDFLELVQLYRADTQKLLDAAPSASPAGESPAPKPAPKRSRSRAKSKDGAGGAVGGGPVA